MQIGVNILRCSTLLLVLTSQAPAHIQAHSHSKSQSWSLASIQNQLAVAGIQTKQDVMIRQPYLSIPARVLVAPDGSEIQVYVYRDIAARKKDIDKLDPTRAAPPTTQVTWLMPVSLVADRNAALIVLSRSPEMHRKIAGVFVHGDSTAKASAEDVVRSFQQALQKRDLKTIEGLVSPALVVFENGERNNGWIDFRDNHLVPEMQEPAPQSQWELVKVKEGAKLAWAYTHETLPSASGTPVVVWSIFVLEKSADVWKITLLDWSVGKVKIE